MNAFIADEATTGLLQSDGRGRLVVDDDKIMTAITLLTMEVRRLQNDIAELHVVIRGSPRREDSWWQEKPASSAELPAIKKSLEVAFDRIRMATNSAGHRGACMHCGILVPTNETGWGKDGDGILERIGPLHNACMEPFQDNHDPALRDKIARQQWIAPHQPDSPKDDKTWAWQTPQQAEQIAKESFAKEPERVDYAAKCAEVKRKIDERKSKPIVGDPGYPY